MNDDTAEFRVLRRGPRRRPHRWLIWSGGAFALLAVAAIVVLTLPVPGLEGYLAGQVSGKVADQVACPGTLPRPPSVTVGGGRLLPQVLHGRFSEIKVAVPDVTLSGVPHASFAATMRDVRTPSGGVTHVGTFDGTIKVAYAHLPAPTGTTFARAADGTLTARTVVPAAASKNVKAKLFLSMKINGETAESTPSRLQIFGRTLPAGQVADLAGGVRKQQLPHLPDGVTYRSIEPRADGVHVSLAGVSTTALATLPTSVGGHDVTYSASSGLLNIGTSIAKIPVATIRTRPVLSAGSLTLQPTAVHALGFDHSPGDPIAKLVLGQIDQKDLTRPLPALPHGVTYRAATVDPAGIHVTLGGTTVQPFSSLPQDADHPAVFGAANGLLTATATGSGAATPIVLHSRPAIRGRTLDLAPSEIEMFGTRFPAAEVLSQVTGQQTAFPLQALAPGLTYAGVTVQPDGLLIHVIGHDASLPRGTLAGGGC
jgi:hypothetical protein